jgi:hypothetical protein
VCLRTWKHLQVAKREPAWTNTMTTSPEFLVFRGWDSLMVLRMFLLAAMPMMSPFLVALQTRPTVQSLDTN